MNLPPGEPLPTPEAARHSMPAGTVTDAPNTHPEAQGTEAPCQSGADELTGLPFLRTWRSVYLLVVGSFILWVLLLLALTLSFS